MKVEFGPWTPDIIPLATPGVATALNVLPLPDGYEAFRSLGAKMSALPEACLRGQYFLDSANDQALFCGTQSGLFKRDPDDPYTWNDVSDVDGYAGDSWEFVQWGNRVIATNGLDQPQYIDITNGEAFDDIIDAPISQHVGVVRDFVVFGNTLEDSTDYPSRVRWSGFNNSETYGSSLSTQADYQDLDQAGGRIQKVVSGDVGVVFLEHSIWYMEYAGPPVVFRFREVERGRGTPASKSVCWFGPQIFYYGHDGFYRHIVGQGSQPIGDRQVDRWFLGFSDRTRLQEMVGVVDRERNLVLWAFCSTTAGDYPDTILVYDIASGRWSYAEQETQTLFEMISPGYNLDTLDQLFTDIDTDSINVDSKAFLGGALVVAGVDDTHRLGTFDAAYLESVIVTGEMGTDDRLWVQGIRPLVTESSTVEVKIGKRDTIGGTVSYGSGLSMNSQGLVPARVNSRYFRFRLALSGGFKRAHGLEIMARKEGRR